MTGAFAGAELARAVEPLVRTALRVAAAARFVAVGDLETASFPVGCAAWGVREPIGSARVDQHRPGLHLFIGDPRAAQTGAGWTARTSLAACQAHGSVCIGGLLVADEGRLVPG